MRVAVENDSAGQKKGRDPHDLKDEAQGEPFFGRDDGRQDRTNEENGYREKPDDTENVALDKIPPNSSKEEGCGLGYVSQIDEVFFSPTVPHSIVIPGDHWKCEE